MAICKQCGNEIPVDVACCTNCGFDPNAVEAAPVAEVAETEAAPVAEVAETEAAPVAEVAETKAAPVAETEATVAPEAAQAPVYAAQPEAPQKKVPENVVAGIVGSLLFGIVGGVLYFLVYQMGFIAAICGLITFVLASFGYGLFSKVKNSTKGMVISIIVTIIVILLSQYLCLSYEIFRTFAAEAGINFFDAVRATPEFLTDSEILTAVGKDLLWAYGLSAIAIISQISNNRKANK